MPRAVCWNSLVKPCKPSPDGPGMVGGGPGRSSSAVQGSLDQQQQKQTKGEPERQVCLPVAVINRRLPTK